MKLSMLDHALAYAKAGYSVFPCQPCGKAPLTPHGHKDATTDEVTIRQWWAQWPEANIGLALAPSGLMVVDPDRHPDKPDGMASFAEVQQGHPLAVPTAHTGGGGLHLFFKRPPVPLKGKPLVEVDVKTDGYVIVPPSLHSSGKRYQWKEGHSLLEIEPLDVPDWLLPHLIDYQAPEPQPLTFKGPNKYPASSGEVLIQRCAFMRHCVEDVAILSEPEWYAGTVGVLAYTVEAPKIVHKYSVEHSGYTEGHTTDKINHWKTDGKGPTTCRSIRAKCGDDYCKACPYNGHVKSPIVLGYTIRPSDQESQLKPFPIEALPVVLRDYALSLASAIQCPVDYAGGGLLAVASILMGGKRSIELAPEWIQQANVWIALVGSPSSKKSPCLEKILTVVRDIEKELVRKYKTEQFAYELDLQRYEAELKNWKKDATGTPPAKPNKPVLKRLITTDSTVEALGELLAANPQGIVMVADELSGWMRSMNQYKGGQGSDRSHYLSMWSNGPMTIDRKNKEPIIVSSPYLTVIGGIQPAVLFELSNQGVEDGMKERLLFSCPLPNTEAPRKGVPIPAEILTSLATCLRRLFESRPVDRVTRKLSQGAQDAFLEARQEWHHRIHSEGFLTELEAYYAKMNSYLGRLALILHEVKLASGESSAEMVEESTMREAYRLAEYFLNHAEAALSMVKQTIEEQRIKKAARWIEKKGLVAVSARDLMVNKVAGCKKTTQARSLLKALHDYGYGVWQEDTARLIFYQE